jgi:hypothetical protein
VGDPENQDMILAIDPGIDKFGLAVLDLSGGIIDKKVILKEKFSQEISVMLDRYNPGALITGDGTGSDWAYGVLSALGKGKVVRVDEKNSTLDARELAWSENPPGGIWKLIPKFFWPSPPDLDAWAAVVIGRRALKK